VRYFALQEHDSILGIPGDQCGIHCFVSLSNELVGHKD